VEFEEKKLLLIGNSALRADNKGFISALPIGNGMRFVENSLY